MNMKKNITGLALCAASLLVLATGCIEETLPKTEATPESIERSTSSMEYMLNGLSSYFMAYDTWGSSGNTNDWGYPCQLYMREVMGEDFPVYDSSYDYWSYIESGIPALRGLLLLVLLLQVHQEHQQCHRPCP